VYATVNVDHIYYAVSQLVVLLFLQCEESLFESRDGCARVEPFTGRKSPNMFAFLLSKHRRLPRDVQPVIQRRDTDIGNPACSKVQRSADAYIKLCDL